MLALHKTKKTIVIILAIFLLSIIAACSTSSQASYQITPEKIAAAQTANKLVIVTSTYALYEFAKTIGGEYTEVFMLLPPGADGHDYEPSMQQIRAITKADMFIYNGAGFELWIDKMLQAIAGDHQLTVVNATEGLQLRTSNHADFDPHVWLSPALAEEQAGLIYQKLLVLLPTQANKIEHNFAQLSFDLRALDKLYYEQLQDVSHRTFVVSHAGYSYLADRYDLTQKSIAGIHPGAEPSNRELRAIIDFLHEQSERHVFFETTVSNKAAQVIADEVGATVLVLHPLANLTADDIAAGDNYFTLMERNLQQLLIALN